MTDEELIQAYRKKYGKSPAFMELVQFKKNYHPSNRFFSEQERLAIRNSNKVKYSGGYIYRQAKKQEHGTEPTTQD